MICYSFVFVLFLSYCHCYVVKEIAKIKNTILHKFFLYLRNKTNSDKLCIASTTIRVKNVVNYAQSIKKG